MHSLISKSVIRSLICLGLSGASMSALAVPVVIDFDENLPTYFGTTTVQENGFTLTSNVPASTLVDNNDLVRSNLGIGGIGNNTQSLFWGANGQTSSITMSNDAGTLFDLVSFEASSLYNAAGALTVTGTLGAGGTVSQVVALTGDLSLVNVLGMANLSSVEFSFDGASYSAPYDLDNINISMVPIPAAVWLMGSGLGLLGALRRRRIT